MKVERVMWVVKTAASKYVDENADEAVSLLEATRFDTKRVAKGNCEIKGDKPVKVRVTVEEI
jgi:hypothetical protein